MMNNQIEVTPNRSAKVFSYSPLPGILFSAYGMEIAPNTELSYEDWKEAGKSWAEIQQESDMAFMWGWADWLNTGELRYGEKYTQAMNETGLAFQTLANYKWLGNCIPRHLRGIKGLRQRHYFAVAKIENQHDKLRMLVEAATESWPASTRLVDEIKQLDNPPDNTLPNPPPATKDDMIDDLERQNHLLERQSVKAKIATAWRVNSERQATKKLIALKEIAVNQSVKDGIDEVISTLDIAPDDNLISLMFEAIKYYSIGNSVEYVDRMEKIKNIIEA